MIKLLKELVTNKIELNDKELFTAIIGLNPSRGARSPILWNKVFKDYFPNMKMISLDVKENNLTELLSLLEQNKFFLGGAISAPYKELVFNFLDANIDNSIKSVKSVNNISKNNFGRLFGHNTDGKAAVISFKNNYDLNINNRVLILGYGGVGKSVSAYFADEIGHSHNISVITNKDLKILKNSHKFINFYNWKDLDGIISNHNLIINCTTLGWGIDQGRSPLTPKLISKVVPKTIFYDVIYQPKISKLLHMANDLNFETMNGEEMNFIQAVIGFKNTISGLANSPSIEQISKSMTSD